MQTLRADLIGAIWRVVLTVFGLQVVLIGVVIAILIEVTGKERRVMRDWSPACGR